MAVIAPISAHGGVGKTTITVHMAHAAAVGGFSVLLVDLAPSAGLSAVLLRDAEVE
ncbi:MAG: ParA family protein, partial [Thermoproteus sp.]|nr:ParA family protein [Thermoproteus sp.]